MVLRIVCYKCNATIRLVYDLCGQTLQELLKELEGRECPMCGHKFVGRQAGPITIK